MVRAIMNMSKKDWLELGGILLKTTLLVATSSALMIGAMMLGYATGVMR